MSRKQIHICSFYLNVLGAYFCIWGGIVAQSAATVLLGGLCALVAILSAVRLVDKS